MLRPRSSWSDRTKFVERIRHPLGHDAAAERDVLLAGRKLCASRMISRSWGFGCVGSAVMRNSSWPSSVIRRLTNSSASWPVFGMMISIAWPYSRIVTSRVPVGSMRRLRMSINFLHLDVRAGRGRVRRQPAAAGCSFELVDQRDAAGQVGAELEFAERDDHDRRRQRAEHQADFPAVVGHPQPVGDHVANDHRQHKQGDDDHDAVAGSGARCVSRRPESAVAAARCRAAGASPRRPRLRVGAAASAVVVVRGSGRRQPASRRPALRRSSSTRLAGGFGGAAVASAGASAGVPPLWSRRSRFPGRLRPTRGSANSMASAIVRQPCATARTAVGRARMTTSSCAHDYFLRSTPHRRRQSSATRAGACLVYFDFPPDDAPFESSSS